MRDLQNFKTEKYGRSYLVSDKWFTNTRVDFDAVCRMISAFENTRLTTNDVRTIFDAAIKYGINPLIIVAKLEQEQSLVINANTNCYDYRLARAMGYGIYNRDNWGFQKQVTRASYCLGRRLTEWEPGVHVVLQPESPVVPSNAATYSLYRYCPHYGKTYHNKKSDGLYATAWRGNQIFIHWNLFFIAKYEEALNGQR